jgi:hypothetical protein
MKESHTATFQLQVQRLHRLTVVSRWLTVVVLWLSAGTASLWSLRGEISLWREYFTWVAIWYALRSQTWPTLGLGLCTGWTLSVLVWQSRNILFGMPSVERRRLERQVWRIRANGSKHPLWKWVVDPASSPRKPKR